MASACDAGNFQTASKTAPDPPPNILIINADDLDFDELATYAQQGRQSFKCGCFSPQYFGCSLPSCRAIRP